MSLSVVTTLDFYVTASRGLLTLSISLSRLDHRRALGAEEPAFCPTTGNYHIWPA